MDRQFHAKVTARDHDAIGDFQNGVIGLHGGGLFDLGQHGGAAFGQFACFDHILGPLDEGQGQPVHTQFAGEFEVLAVLVRQRGQGQQHVRHVHALAVRDGAADGHDAIGEILAAGFDPNGNLAVIDQQRGPRLQRGENLGVGQLHARSVARSRVQIEAELVALHQIMRPGGKGADTQLGALKVRKDADRAAGIGLDLTDDHVAGTDVIMGAMRHIQAEHIGPGFEQRTDRLVVAGGRAQGGHDLYVPKASHMPRSFDKYRHRGGPPVLWRKPIGGATGAFPFVRINDQFPHANDGPPA